MAELLYQGHASFRLTLNNGKVVYIDPYAGEGYDLPADLILVTHQHPDHNAVDLMPHSPDCVILQNSDMLKNGEYQKAEHYGMTIEATEAYNLKHDKSKCVGYLVNADGVLLYFAGDTAETEQMPALAERNIDYAFLPIDGIFTMNAKQASHCAELIGAKYNIPIHMSPGKLFDRKKAEKFEAAGRIIIGDGEKLSLED